MLLRRFTTAAAIGATHAGTTMITADPRITMEARVDTD
jgi:hypothetical protein